jgi:hypothetical protein
MEKEFIPNEQSLDLKGLGFDAPCIRGWYEDGGIWYHPDSDIILDNPTFSQAFRWFREKYCLNSFIVDSKSYDWYFNINDMQTDDVISEVLYFKKYEEAELECLKKLIEIVKNKKESV